MAVKKSGFFAGAAVGVGVAAAAMIGAGAHWPAAMAAESQPVNSGPMAFAPPPGAPGSFADIFAKVSPAVVTIDVTTKVKPQSNIDLLRRFGIPVPPNMRPAPPPGTPKHGTKPQTPDSGDDNDDGGDDTGAGEARASGSGFFVSPDGYIVTNNHVIENADSITVTLTDKRELKAKVVGRDEGTDLAVLKVEGHDYPFVTFENKAKPRVGDWVIAIGNPYLLGGTATAGIISYAGRDIGDKFVDYLQIDAPINRGNSGGPTFDVYGRVVGVNTAIFSPSGGSVGIGFAIPADVAEKVSRQLMEGKKITRGYLGVGVYDLTKEVAEARGLGTQRGALVGEVTPGGPAAKAGVVEGDVITSVNGHKVENRGELTRAVAATETGGDLKLQIIRGGKPQTLVAKAGLRPAEAVLDAQLSGKGGEDENLNPPANAKPVTLGLGLAPITDEARKRFELKPGAQGVVVTSVAPDSEAAKIGLKPGDVIVRAGEAAVHSPAEVAAAVAEAKKAGRPSVFLMVARDGATAPLALKFGKAG
jgi:serine protease Do